MSDVCKKCGAALDWDRGDLCVTEDGRAFFYDYSETHVLWLEDSCPHDCLYGKKQKQIALANWGCDD